jgi:hypothetical protein
MQDARNQDAIGLSSVENDGARMDEAFEIRPNVIASPADPGIVGQRLAADF